MRWEDERYVRLYTRDTLTWLSLSLEAQGLLALLLRKVDRAGILRLGSRGIRGVAAAIGHAGRWATIGPALDELMAEQVVQLTGKDGETALVFPNFIAAQEARQSDRARQQGKRERDRDKAIAAGFSGSADGADTLAALDRADVTDTPPAVTPERHAGASRSVTDRHAGDVTPAVTPERHAGGVTPSRAVPRLAVPDSPLASSPPADAGAAGALVLQVQDAKTAKAREPSSQQRFKAAALDLRAQMRPGLLPDPAATWSAQRCNKALGPVVEALGVAGALEAFRRFLGVERMAAQKPGWPLWIFSQDWPSYAAPGQTAVATSGAGLKRLAADEDPWGDA